MTCHNLHNVLAQGSNHTLTLRMACSLSHWNDFFIRGSLFECRPTEVAPEPPPLEPFATGLDQIRRRTFGLYRLHEVLIVLKCEHGSHEVLFLPKCEQVT